MAKLSTNHSLQQHDSSTGTMRRFTPRIKPKRNKKAKDYALWNKVQKLLPSGTREEQLREFKIQKKIRRIQSSDVLRVSYK